MKTNKAIALVIGLASSLLVVTAQAALVKWTLNDVQLASYNPDFGLDNRPNPVVDSNNTARVAASGWFLFDTTALAVTDWNISRMGSNFSPGCIFFNDFGCAADNTATVSPGPLIGSELFEFAVEGSPSNSESLQIATLGLSDLGGTEKLIFGDYVSGHFGIYEIATEGSLIGTVVPEASGLLYLAIGLGMLQLLRRSSHIRQHAQDSHAQG